MKILQIIPDIGAGGAERFVVDLSNELSLRNTVNLLTFYSPKENDLFRKELFRSVSTFTVKKKLGFDYQLFRRIYKIILELQPDVIHTHLRGLNYLIPLLPFLKRVPVIHTIHNDAFKECPSKLQRKIRKYCFSKGYVVPVTISLEGQRSFDAAYNKTESNIIINGRMEISPSISKDKVHDEIKRFKVSTSDLVFINIGRMEYQKNQLMLINAFKKLINIDEANAILLIVGGARNSEESKKIHNEIKSEADQNPRIHLLGEKANATDYLYASDYFCLSSLFEGMPISLIEAFATGTIPICTPVGGIPEMINDLDPSLLANSNNEDDYYEALKTAYSFTIMRKSQLADKAVRIYKEKYSISNCASQYESLYKKSTY